MSRRRTWVRRLGVLGCAPLSVGLVAVAGLVWLRTPPGNAFLLANGLSVAHGTRVGKNVAAGELATDLWSQAELTDVAVRDDAGRALVHANAVTLGVDKTALAHGALHLTELRVHGFSVAVKVGADGTVDLLDALHLTWPDLATRLPMNLQIGRAHV